MRWWMLCLAACGRISFTQEAPLSDAGHDAPELDASPTACAAFGPWKAPTRVAASIVAQIDQSPALSRDGLDLYFQSAPNVPFQQDLYISHRASTTDDFVTSAKISNTAINSPTSDELDVTVAANGTHVYFSTNRDLPDQTLYETTRTGDTFSPPVRITELNEATIGPWVNDADTEMWLGFPNQLRIVRRASASDSWPTTSTPVTLTDGAFVSITANGLEVYYEFKNTGRGQVYHASRTDPLGTFGTPDSIDVVNQATNDCGDPEISQDGTELYFDATAGADEDLYVSRRDCL